MFGSSEGHMCYLYRRKGNDRKIIPPSEGVVNNESGVEASNCPDEPCDKLFQKDYEFLRSSTSEELIARVQNEIQKDVNLVKCQGSHLNNVGRIDENFGTGPRKSGRERRRPRKFSIEGYEADDFGR
mmetsp:Transcript_13170/g.24551  ORF Transcript_13170/g.24551 Transcript_13170/m.24551 type:complete len:127 (-) Transcript_13170:23-403(-)